MKAVKIFSLVCIVCAMVAMLFRGGPEPQNAAIASVTKFASTTRASGEQSGPQNVPVDARTEFQALLESLNESARAGSDALKRLQRIAETRPTLAIDLALALSSSKEDRIHWVTELTRTWARRDAQAAWNWLAQEMPRVEEWAGNSLVDVVLNEMAARDPERVIENVDTLLVRGPIEGAIPALVARQLGLNAVLAHGDLETARKAVERWAQNSDSQPLDSSAFDVVAGAIGNNSWSDAAAWLETLPASTERNSAFAVLASKWADHDTIAALSWAETLGAGNGRDAAIGTVFADWVERDGSRAGDWLLSYVDRAESDSEVDGLIGRLVTFSPRLQQDPLLAIEWVGLIRNSPQRDASMERVIKQWGRRDPAAARYFVDIAPDLSAPQRQSLKANLIAQAVEPDPVVE